MDNIKESILNNLYVLMFLLAVPNLLIETKEFTTYISYVNSTVEDNKYIQRSFVDSKTERDQYVTYEELISTLMGTLSCNINIDGIEIDKETYSYELFDFNRIVVRDYKKLYTYSNEGNLIKIFFK